MKSRILWWSGVAATTLLVFSLLSLAYGLWQVHTFTGAPWNFHLLTGGSEVVDARHHTITFTKVHMYGLFGTPLWLFPTCLLLAAAVCFHLSNRFRSAPGRVE